MDGRRTEACGRCSMTTVVDAAVGETGPDDEKPESDADGPGDARDPFAGGHIEVDEAAVRTVSPSAWLASAKRRLDGVVKRLTYG